MFLLYDSTFALVKAIASASPIGMQYSIEITDSTPEDTTKGLNQLFGQALVVFLYIMEALKLPNGAFSPALLFSISIFGLSDLLITHMNDGGWLAAT